MFPVSFLLVLQVFFSLCVLFSLLVYHDAFFLMFLMFDQLFCSATLRLYPSAFHCITTHSCLLITDRFPSLFVSYLHLSFLLFFRFLFLPIPFFPFPSLPILSLPFLLLPIPSLFSYLSLSLSFLTSSFLPFLFFIFNTTIIQFHSLPAFTVITVSYIFLRFPFLPLPNNTFPSIPFIFTSPTLLYVTSFPSSSFPFTVLCSSSFCFCQSCAWGHYVVNNRACPQELPNTIRLNDAELTPVALTSPCLNVTELHAVFGRSLLTLG